MSAALVGVEALRAYLHDERRAARYGAPRAEYGFARPHRAWRFDFAYEALRLAVEYEGGAGKSGKSRHRTDQGYADDAQKYACAGMLGWLVIRVTRAMVEDGSAWLLIDAALELRRAELLHQRPTIGPPMVALLGKLPKQVSRLKKRQATSKGKSTQGREASKRSA